MMRLAIIGIIYVAAYLVASFIIGHWFMLDVLSWQVRDRAVLVWIVAAIGIVAVSATHSP